MADDRDSGIGKGTKTHLRSFGSGACLLLQLSDEEGLTRSRLALGWRRPGWPPHPSISMMASHWVIVLNMQRFSALATAVQGN